MYARRCDIGQPPAHHAMRMPVTTPTAAPVTIATTCRSLRRAGGYLRLVSPDGKTVLAGTRQLTGNKQLDEVKDAMREALDALDIEVPDYLQ